MDEFVRDVCEYKKNSYQHGSISIYVRSYQDYVNHAIMASEYLKRYGHLSNHYQFSYRPCCHNGVRGFVMIYSFGNESMYDFQNRSIL